MSGDVSHGAETAMPLQKRQGCMLNQQAYHNDSHMVGIGRMSERL